MLTKGQIKFLDRVCRGTWTENNNTIDVNGWVYMSHEGLNKIYIQFGKVTESFFCRENNLNNLLGCPNTIIGTFDCCHNKLTSLEGGPIIVNSYACSNNSLTNLINAPKKINDYFYCHSNQLTSLRGCPSIIKGKLSCTNNSNLHILYGIGRVESDVYYDNRNDLNEWIIEQARTNIFVSYTDIAEWIKRNNKLEYLLYAQPEIRQYFSPRILHNSDMGIYNI